jgi:hypothetical protein
VKTIHEIWVGNCFNLMDIAVEFCWSFEKTSVLVGNGSFGTKEAISF